MFGLRFTFPAGRYHATPWGRHVNEADVAWPPEPWRVLRALIATWHRKADRDAHPEPALAALVDALAADLPDYVLPPAVHAHSRHYMPWFKKGPDDRTLVFDAFARLEPAHPLVMVWPHVALAPAEQALAAHLAERLGYLGRAESWVEVTCLDAAEAAEAARTANCRTADRMPDADPDDHDALTLLAPLSPADAAIVRERLTHEAAALSPKKRAQRLAAVGTTLLDALQMDTTEWQGAGFARPPAARQVPYLRPADSLLPDRRRARTATASASSQAPVHTVRYRLSGKPLPPMTDALRVGETVRKALLSLAGQLLDGAPIPWALSGHDLPDGAIHRHAFFLPEDTDGDGRIDALTVHVPEGLPPACRRVLGALRKLYDDRKGATWQVTVAAMDGAQPLAPHLPLLMPARVWQSRTPYLHPWHRKAGFGREEQLLRELVARALPAPEAIEWLAHLDADGSLRPAHFRRSYGGHKRRPRPDTQGSFCRLTFPRPVPGPLALGFACHHGLGLFAPVADGDDDIRR